MRKFGVLARRAWLVPIFLPAVVIFPLLDRVMGAWWGFPGVGLYVVALFLWVQLPRWTGRTTRARNPRHRSLRDHGRSATPPGTTARAR